MNKVYAVFNENWTSGLLDDDNNHCNDLIGLFVTKERALEAINRFPDNMFGDDDPDEYEFESVIRKEDVIIYSGYYFGYFDCIIDGKVYVEELEVQE